MMSCDLTVNFLLAGRDTTAQLISWFMYYMGKEENSEVYERIVDELNTVIGSNPLTDEVSWEHVSKLKYLEKALCESLRLQPSAPHLVRYARCDIPLDTGHIIRKGILYVCAFIYSCCCYFPLPCKRNQPTKREQVVFKSLVDCKERVHFI